MAPLAMKPKAPSAFGSAHRQPQRCLTLIRRAYTQPRASTQRQAERSASSAGKAEPRLRVLTALSKLCEVKGMTTIYETVAGRSAMLGVITALIVETLTDGEALLSQLSGTNWTVALASLGLSTLIAAVLGAQGLDSQKPVLLEPVITSLTAAQRSGSSVTVGSTPTNIDKVVDEVVTTTFTKERIRELTDFEADL